MAHTSLTSLFSDIADAIRAKTGGSSAIVADDFPTAIAAIQAGLTFASPVTAQRTNNLNINFSNLAAEPKFFVLFASASSGVDITSTGNSRTVFVQYDGTNTKGAYMLWTKNSNTAWTVVTTYSYSWDSTTNTLTITAPSGRQFQSSHDYTLLYAY